MLVRGLAATLRAMALCPTGDRSERAIDGGVGLPGSESYEAHRRPFNARFHEVRQPAVVSCANAHDVSRPSRSSAVTARRSPFAPAGTASPGIRPRGVLLDVGPMQSVSVSGGIVIVGAGATLGEVYRALEEHGLAIPGSTCPSVGVCGLTLGGGLQDPRPDLRRHL